MRLNRFIKKAVAILCASVITFSMPLVTSAEQGFETAESVVSKITVGWNLGNSLDVVGDWIKLYTKAEPVDYEIGWSNVATTKELITSVKRAGFNAIRVPVTWSDHIDDEANINEAWLNRVQEVVDYVVSQDLYCIINVHHDGGADGWLEASTEGYRDYSRRYAVLWTNIAKRFKDYDEKLMFESFNEILDSKNSWTYATVDGAYEAVNKFNQLFVDTVRATGGNNAERNLSVQTYSSSCDKRALDAFVLPEDLAENHLIIQVHNYYPHGFTSLDATWTTMTDKWGTDAEKKYFDELFELLEDFSEKQNAPVIVGEFAACYKENEDARALYASCFVEKAKQHGIKCFWWDTGSMALFDREKARVSRRQVVDALIEAVNVEITPAIDLMALFKSIVNKIVWSK